MSRPRISPHWGLATWSIALGATVLCLFAVGSMAYFLSHPFASDRTLAKAMGFSATLTTLVMMVGGHVQVVVYWTLCMATCFVCMTGFLAALIMVKAPDQPANRQVAGLLLAFAGLLALRFFFNVLPGYQVAYKQWPELFELADFTLLVYLGLGLARFLFIFPRAVDPESVHQSYTRRPFVMRWSSRSRADSNLLRHWQTHLVSGRLLWLAAVGPAAGYLAVISIDTLIPFDIWGGILFAVLAGIVGMYFLWGLPYAFASISHLYRFGTHEERQRVAWLRAALLGLGTIGLLSLLLPVIANAVSVPSPRPSLPLPVGTLPVWTLAEKLSFSFVIFWSLIPVITIVCVGVAVLNNGALDPRLAFTRVTVWSIMGLFVTLAFIALERFAAIQVVHWFALPPDTGAVAAGAVIAASFVPIRRFVATHIEQMARQLIPLDVVADGVRITRALALSNLSGYTTLSAKDEQGAILQSAALSRQAERLAHSHAGHFVKSMGEGVMMIFEDPEDALTAVEQLHASFPDVSKALGLEAIGLHSAIHFGEIVQLNDGDIFGQTVNLASRLVSTARSGDIVVSDEFLEGIEAQQRFQSMGQRRFKNLPKSIGCHRLDSVAPRA